MAAFVIGLILALAVALLYFAWEARRPGRGRMRGMRGAGRS